jgi:hypothetical protein
MELRDGEFRIERRRDIAVYAPPLKIEKRREIAVQMPSWPAL